jgi:hypothetical protein
MLESVDTSLRNLYLFDGDEPQVVEVPELGFLMVDGEGDPASDVYAQTVTVLMQIAAVTWRRVDRRLDAPLEGLWSGDLTDRSTWRWTSMVLQPAEVSQATLADAIATFGSATSLEPLPAIRFERFSEGEAVQVLHRGPHAEETPTIERMHEFIAEQGFSERGRHHEIYLTDVFEVAPEDSRTVLRQPVTRT